MITLDGNEYSVHLTKYAEGQKKLGMTARGVTGQVLRVETGAFQMEYSMTLLCELADIVTLKASFDKTLSGSPLDFTDEKGTRYSPDAGTNTSMTYFSTGVYFDPMGEPQPLTVLPYQNNRFLVPIQLVSAAFTLAPVILGHLLTEAGDYMTTEDGSRLTYA